MRRIGMCWAGQARAKATLAEADQRRSMPVHLLSPLFPTPGAVFYNLQKDAPASTIPASVIDVMPEMNDFADTAALVAALDLVITVIGCPSGSRSRQAGLAA